MKAVLISQLVMTGIALGMLITTIGMYNKARLLLRSISERLKAEAESIDKFGGVLQRSSEILAVLKKAAEDANQKTS